MNNSMWSENQSCSQQQQYQTNVYYSSTNTTYVTCPCLYNVPYQDLQQPYYTLPVINRHQLRLCKKQIIPIIDPNTLKQINLYDVIDIGIQANLMNNTKPQKAETFDIGVGVKGDICVKTIETQTVTITKKIIGIQVYLLADTKSMDLVNDAAANNSTTLEEIELSKTKRLQRSNVLKGNIHNIYIKLKKYANIFFRLIVS